MRCRSKRNNYSYSSDIQPVSAPAIQHTTLAQRNTFASKSREQLDCNRTFWSIVGSPLHPRGMRHVSTSLAVGSFHLLARGLPSSSPSIGGVLNVHSALNFPKTVPSHDGQKLVWHVCLEKEHSIIRSF